MLQFTLHFLIAGVSRTANIASGDDKDKDKNTLGMDTMDIMDMVGMIMTSAHGFLDLGLGYVKILGQFSPL